MSLNPEIILHIGGEKTGTTSIQNLLGKQQLALRTHGVLFPQSPQWNHVLVPLLGDLGESTRDLRFALSAEDRENIDTVVAKFPEHLRTEISDSSCSKVIISSEHCSSRLSEDGAHKVVDMLRTISNNVKIVYYARPQDELLLSAYSTAVKSGYSGMYHIPSGPGGGYYDHSAILKKWENSIGIENIAVRIYQEQNGGEFNAIDDFFRVCGLPLELAGSESKSSDRLNRALAGKPMEFLRILNAHLPPYINGVPDQRRWPLLTALEKLSEGNDRGICIKDAFNVIYNFYRSCKQSNDEVAKRYSCGTDGRLFTRTGPIDVAEIDPLSNDDLMRIWISVLDHIPAK